MNKHDSCEIIVSNLLIYFSPDIINDGIYFV